VVKHKGNVLYLILIKVALPFFPTFKQRNETIKVQNKFEFLFARYKQEFLRSVRINLAVCPSRCFSQLDFSSPTNVLYEGIPFWNW